MDFNDLINARLVSLESPTVTDLQHTTIVTVNAESVHVAPHW